MVVACLLVGGPARALTLGEVKVESRLGQPLRARIALRDLKDASGSPISARLGSVEDYARAGFERAAIVDTMQAHVGQDASGQPVIWVVSDDPVNEPVLSVLVEVRWAAGQMVREVALSFEPSAAPPGLPVAAAPAAPAVAVAAVAAAPEPPPAPPAPPAPPSPPAARVVAAPTPVVERAPDAEERAAPVRSAPRSPAESADAGSALAPGSSYRVQRHDTLYGLARRLGAATRDEYDRTMLGIYRANPEAFGGGVRRLRTGVALSIPEASSLNAIDPAEARHAVATLDPGAGASGGAAEGAGDGERHGHSGHAGHGRLTLRLTGPVDGVALQSRVQALEAQVAETRRLLEISNAELARLAAAAGSRAGAVATTPVPPVAAPPATTPAVPPTAATPPAPASAPPPAEATSAPPEPPAAGSDAAAPMAAALPDPNATDAGDTPPPPPRAPPPVPAPDLSERLADLWPWLLGGVGIAVVIVGIVVRELRRRRAARTPPPSESASARAARGSAPRGPRRRPG